MADTPNIPNIPSRLKPPVPHPREGPPLFRDDPDAAVEWMESLGPQSPGVPMKGLEGPQITGEEFRGLADVFRELNDTLSQEPGKADLGGGERDLDAWFERTFAELTTISENTMPRRAEENAGLSGDDLRGLADALRSEPVQTPPPKYFPETKPGQGYNDDEWRSIMERLRNRTSELKIDDQFTLPLPDQRDDERRPELLPPETAGQSQLPPMAKIVSDAELQNMVTQFRDVVAELKVPTTTNYDPAQLPPTTLVPQLPPTTLAASGSATPPPPSATTLASRSPTTLSADTQPSSAQKKDECLPVVLCPEVYVKLEQLLKSTGLPGPGTSGPGNPSGPKPSKQVDWWERLDNLSQKFERAYSQDRLEVQAKQNFKAVDKVGQWIGGEAGGILSMVGKFGSRLLETAERLRSFGLALHEANMRFAETSPSMALVQAQHQYRMFMLDFERGERRSKSADLLSRSNDALSKELAPYEDAFADVKNYLTAIPIMGVVNALEAIGKMVKYLQEIHKKIVGEKDDGKDDKSPELTLNEWGVNVADDWYKDYGKKPVR